MNSKSKSAAESATLAIPLEGALLRKNTGEIYQVTGHCELEGSQDTLLLFQSLDPRLQDGIRAVSLNQLNSSGPGEGPPLFRAVPAADTQALRQFWDKHFAGDLSRLQGLIARYEEPWRYLHTPRYAYRLFEAAQALALPLTKEEGLAVLLSRISVLPGAPDEVQLRQAQIVAKSLCTVLSGAKVRWDWVWRALDPLTKGPVRDLLNAHLAFDALEFCVNEELAWLESRALFAGATPRKDYDTLRLTQFIAKTGQGALFSNLPETWERKARVNIEGLRQAWRQRYAAGS